MKNIRVFLSKTFQFLEVKFSMYLNRRVFVMRGGIHILVFLFLHENIYCEYSLEALQWGTSYEYRQHLFYMAIRKISVRIFLLKMRLISIYCCTSFLNTRSKLLKCLHYCRETYMLWHPNLAWNLAHTSFFVVRHL